MKKRRIYTHTTRMSSRWFKELHGSCSGIPVIFRGVLLYDQMSSPKRTDENEDEKCLPVVVVTLAQGAHWQQRDHLLTTVQTK